MYDREKLELMYFLTQNKNFMNHTEAARVYSKHKGISERTVRRWFKSLQKNCFDYFPALHYDNLGLCRVFVLIENLKDLGFLSIHPYLNYIYVGTDFQNLKKTFVLGYYIPEDKLKDFECFLHEAKQKGLFDYHISFVAKSAIPYAYAPFHSVVLPDGHLQFNEEHDVSYFLERLETAKKPINLEVRNYVNTNPLVIPILMEYMREHWSSKKVWFNAKQKLGPKIWDYVKSIKKRKKKRDSIGIKLVQDTIWHINQNPDQFFLQTRVEYAPFHSKSVILFILLKLKNQEILSKVCESVAKNALITGFCIGRRNKKFLGLYIVTNVEKFNDIICNVLPQNCDVSFKPKIVLLNKEEAKYYWASRERMKFDYSKVFDPKKCEWIYEHGKYMAELKRLSTEG